MKTQLANQDVVIVAFYKFVHLPDFKERQSKLLEFCKSQGVKGSILLASEGINGTIAGSRDGIDTVLNHLHADEVFADLEHKESFADFIPFGKMKVRLKTEIVHLGMTEIDPATQQVGTYVDPKEWNELILDPEVVVIDTRNDYEFEVGTFQRALNPETKSFGEFPEYVAQNLDPNKHKKVAMFCTGGIRCEKATTFMLQQGFENVYHLRGGILKYLEDIPQDESTWKGECFVFDERITVDHDLQKGSVLAGDVPDNAKLSEIED